MGCLCQGGATSVYPDAASPDRGAPSVHWLRPWSLGHLEGAIMVKECALHCTLAALLSIWLGQEGGRKGWYLMLWET